MPSISPKDLKVLDMLSKEYRIVFAGHYETPWKSNVKFLANNLVARAKRNVKRNESSWRMSCEPLIFARLSGEVVCRNCRKRIWRSEIEASCVINTQRRLALQKRQEAREPCRCPRIARSQDHLEAIGLNRIFGHREDEVVRHDPVVARRLGKRIQKPDAIYGLRQTRNIENFLHDTRKSEARQLVPTDGKQLHEELDPSPIDQPLDQNGDELLYPFLVLEAKSDWRISVAYMAEDTQKRNTIGHKDYVIIDVWQGSIVTRDGALQLLLLVDYVFDWARDVYREDIIRKLRLLASGDNDAASILYTDTDIFSTRQVDLSEMHTSAVGNEDYEAYIRLSRL
ncbi:hypothetical protein NKR23_g12027 [Pleurostoma richardsiae]|uniref:Uncharacterized protein n=1 Tax=Pleurostoma richardsiae TaxID=41990 RepID=A0AA38VGJ6_9PEZI|nr:hypothetical protein NKR23_g12027 [Pleurostoma richardsiae]